jgi:MFS family permease
VRSNLFRRGFLSLIVTQFFGAANDNILKQVLIYMVTTGVWSGMLGRGGQAYVALCLTVPFIVLSGYAGQFADRRSKRTVALLVKVVEVPIAIVAFVGLYLQILWITIAALLLLAIQSTFFGPAKYGMIPELVEEGDLSRANGLLNMMTNIAIIVGTLAAGPLSDAYFPRAQAGIPPDQAMLWLPGTALILVALAGLAASLFLPRLKAMDPALRYNPNPFSIYIVALREMARTPLLMVALAWGFFYMIGMTAILILPEYESVLNISFTKTSYLIGVLGVAIGVGSVLAGWISGHHIQPRLIPVGAVGMTVFFVLLGAVPPEFWSVAAMLLGAGIFAGFYIVPLQALLQKLSPGDERGRFLGTANALSFVFSTVGALIYWAAVNVLALPPNRVFVAVAVLSALGTGYMVWRLRGKLRSLA